MGGQVTPTSTVVASTQQVATQVGDEAMILNLADNKYYGLNEVGTRIWNLMQNPIKVQTIQTVLMAEYEVTAAQCLEEVLALLNQLAQCSLVEVTDDPPSA